jgi:hypothetical protein
MNTTAKGNDFEARVFYAIENELNAERLGILPHSCQIFWKKPYYSKERGSDIIVDISIEITLPNLDKWSLLWVWECKDYKGAVPVDDVEEFHAKIEQIAGDNVKGTMAVSGGLQRAALIYALSKGIGIVRIMPDNQVLHISARRLGVRNKKFINRLEANHFIYELTNPDAKAFSYFCSIANKYGYADWYSLIKDTIDLSI